MSNSNKAEQASIMVVEDEVLIRMELVDLIEEQGFKAFEAGNADEAIKILNEHSDIHILITDVDMPGSMDGLKLSHYVKDRWPPVKIVVASGHVKVKQSELPEKGVFLDKPYDTPRMRILLTNLAAEIDPA